MKVVLKARHGWGTKKGGRNKHGEDRQNCKQTKKHAKKARNNREKQNRKMQLKQLKTKANTGKTNTNKQKQKQGHVLARNR
jgi:hypothetical protein